MPEVRFDVVGVGNAIVDVIANVEDSFIETHGLNRASMTLIDEDRAHTLYEAMPPGIEASGGSAANTMAGLASFGSRAAYIGKVRDDQLGEVFGHDMRAAGVHYVNIAAAEGPATARCLIQVTPDAERTMNTFLGISALLEPGDIDEELVASASVLYCEGYLWDVDVAKDAIRKAMDVAGGAGRTVALTLSDSFCVERHHAEWLELIGDKVDLLFANEDEIRCLYGTDDLDRIQTAMRGHVGIACITRGSRGSSILTADRIVHVPVEPVAHVVDTTGAGDLYASGFLHGFSRGLPLETCGTLASLAAAEVIAHLGARPAVSLERLAGERG
jgi:sugar/nucleoside kinase (ribokinase family)